MTLPRTLMLLLSKKQQLREKVVLLLQMWRVSEEGEVKRSNDLKKRFL